MTYGGDDGRLIVDASHVGDWSTVVHKVKWWLTVQTVKHHNVKLYVTHSATLSECNSSCCSRVRPLSNLLVYAAENTGNSIQHTLCNLPVVTFDVALKVLLLIRLQANSKLDGAGTAIRTSLHWHQWCDYQDQICRNSDNLADDRWWQWCFDLVA